MKVLGVIAGLLLSAQGFAAEPRTVFVQLFEWPWKSVAEECERYLGPNGFAAVQVSPPTEHITTGKNQWWERYQPVSHKLDSRAGNEDEFRDMVRRCKAAGVDVYADVVLNHMTAGNGGTGFAGSKYQHYDYPGLFGQNDFHNCGRNADKGHPNDIMNYNDIYELQNCELLDLADINTGAPAVQEKLAGYLRKLLEIGVGGFRVDAAKHMSADDIVGIFQKVGKKFYAVHELITGPGEPVPVGPYTKSGDVNVFPYAYGIGMAMRGGDLTSLLQLSDKFGVKSDEAVVFLENHDLERRPKEEPLVTYVTDQALNRLGTVFLLTYPYGYPQLYSGYRFNADYDQGPPVDGQRRTISPLGKDGNCLEPWTCAHRQPGVAELVRFRNRANGEFRATDVAQPKASLLSYGRGNLGHVVMNASGNPENVKVATRMRAGTYCNLLDGNNCADVNDRGELQVTVAPKSAFVIQDPRK